MKLYMLDTNIASAAIRGRAELDNKLVKLTSEQWCVSAITRSELLYGLALRPKATKLAGCVRAFLETAVTLPWGEAAADRHGQLRAALRLKGEPIGDFDEMIAAHALSLGAILVTDNTQHFRRVSGLKIENWLRSDP